MSRKLIKFSQEELGLIYDSVEFEIFGTKTTIYPFSVAEVTKMIRLAGENFSQVARAVVVLMKRMSLQELLDKEGIPAAERAGYEEAIQIADEYIGSSMNTFLESLPIVVDAYPEVFERCTGIDRETLALISAEDFGRLFKEICSVNKTQVDALIKNLFASIAYLAPLAQEVATAATGKKNSKKKN